MFIVKATFGGGPTEIILETENEEEALNCRLFYSPPFRYNSFEVWVEEICTENTD